MMMKKLCFIISVLLCTMASAQEQKVRQKVVLRNGTELNGYVMGQPDGGYIIETDMGDVFYYTASEIRRIVSVDADKAEMTSDEVGSKRKSRNEPVYFKRKGYMGIVSVWGGDGVSVAMVNGYRFSPHFYMGVETGFGYCIENGPGIPMNLYLMSEFSKKRTSMYVDFSIGAFAAFSSDFVFQTTLTLGGRTRMRKNPDCAIWYGLNIGLRQYWYGYTTDYGHYVGHNYDTDWFPVIGPKISFSF